MKYLLAIAISIFSCDSFSDSEHEKFNKGYLSGCKGTAQKTIKKMENDGAFSEGVQPEEIKIIKQDVIDFYDIYCTCRLNALNENVTYSEIEKKTKELNMQELKEYISSKSNLKQCQEKAQNR